ncbi:MAG TPA: acyl carrier protein [Actinophytocola sp.]|nr:acyl carrier protein [Actinophytocola sp.]
MSEENPSTADVVVTAWQRVLDVPEVSDDDDFFELGGHSIMVTRIVSYLRRELGVEVDMLQVWDTPTFGEFRAAVEELVDETAGSERREAG